MHTHNQHIRSNVAVVGRSAWKASDLVRSVRFNVEHTRDLLTHEKKLKRQVRASPFSQKNDYLVDIAVGSLTIRIGYSRQYSFTLNHATDIWPTIELEFELGETLLEYLDHVKCVTQFLSAAIGVPLIPSDLSISRLTTRQIMAQVKKAKYPGDHQVEYIWHKPVIDPADLWVGGSFVRAWDDEELAAFCACLTAWIERQNVWDKPNQLMFQALGFRKEISAQRLLNACRWFEELPNAGSIQSIATEDISTIAKVASEKSKELGYSTKITKRVSGLLRSIKQESHEERFTRLVTIVRSKFGENIVYENVVEFLCAATGFRNRCAHGHFEPNGQAEFERFAHSIIAMECICYLLTVLDLPASAEGIERVSGSAVLQSYRMSYLGLGTQEC